MAYIKCDGCGEIIEIPAELCPDPETIAITEPYYCDACETEYGGLTQHGADSSICSSCGHMDGYHPEWCMAGE